MKYVTIVIVFTCLLLGCGRSPTTRPGRVSQQASALEVPTHLIRDRYLGEWESDGETVLVIQKLDESTVTVHSIQDQTWKSVINNIRWNDNTLDYDEYMYYTGAEDFTTSSNPTGDHPFSGIRAQITLSLTDDPDRLNQVVSTVHMQQPIEGELTRSPQAE